MLSWFKMVKVLHQDIKIIRKKSVWLSCCKGLVVDLFVIQVVDDSIKILNCLLFLYYNVFVVSIVCWINAPLLDVYIVSFCYYM